MVQDIESAQDWLQYAASHKEDYSIFLDVECVRDAFALFLTENNAHFKYFKDAVEKGQTTLRQVLASFDETTSDELWVFVREYIRKLQAKRLWDLGAAKELGFENFETWLRSVPSVPKRPEDPELDTPVLVPDRSRIGITKSCELLGIKFNGNDKTFVDAEPKKALSGTYWIWCQNGNNYRGKKPRDCRDELFPKKGQVALTAHEGLWLFAENRDILKRHYIDLPGSLDAENRDNVAYLLFWDSRPELLWDWVDYVSDSCGSASRGSVEP